MNDDYPGGKPIYVHIEEFGEAVRDLGRILWAEVERSVRASVPWMEDELECGTCDHGRCYLGYDESPQGGWFSCPDCKDGRILELEAQYNHTWGCPVEPFVCDHPLHVDPYEDN